MPKKRGRENTTTTTVDLDGENKQQQQECPWGPGCKLLAAILIDEID